MRCSECGEISFSGSVCEFCSEISICESCGDEFRSLFSHSGLCGSCEYLADEIEYDIDDESMDGDFDSAMASAGHGTDEDYGYFGGDE